MGKFGKKGVRDKRISVVDTYLYVNKGEHLHFYIKCYGANPVFNLACEHGVFWDETSFPGHPKQEYEKTWPQTPDEIDSANESIGVAFSFLATLKYSLRVEIHNNQETVISVIKDIDYESDEPTDFYFESFTVRPR